jgi:tetratricopeptide (TPR) repeat protein
MLACMAIVSNNSPAIFHLRIPKRGVGFIARAIVTGVGLSAFLYCAVQFKAHKTWQYATLINDEHRSVALGLYEQAYADLKYRAPFLYNYGAQLYEWGDYSKSIEILEQSRKLTPNIDLLLYLGKAYQQNKQFEKAEQCFIDAVNMVPSKFNPPYFLTTLYMQYGKRDLATPIARQVLDMPVKVPSPEVDSIRAYMKKIVFK